VTERPVVLVKLGGSLITDKHGDASARPAVIRRLAREIVAGARRGGVRVVLGHGSGSFGHVAARAGGLDRGLRHPSQRGAVARTQSRARDLHALVVEALSAAGAVPFSLAPSSFLTCRDGAVRDVFAAPLLAALDRGLLPVVYGDVVMDATRGVTIASTEQVLVALVSRLARYNTPVAAALWMGRTRGVHDDRGRRIELITPRGWTAIRRHVGGAGAVDVTGGMTHRVESALLLARRGIPSLILDGRRTGVLAAALAGRPVDRTRIPLED